MLMKVLSGAWRPAGSLGFFRTLFWFDFRATTDGEARPYMSFGACHRMSVGGAEDEEGQGWIAWWARLGSRRRATRPGYSPK